MFNAYMPLSERDISIITTSGGEREYSAQRIFLSRPPGGKRNNLARADCAPVRG